MFTKAQFAGDRGIHKVLDQRFEIGVVQGQPSHMLCRGPPKSATSAS